MLKNLSVFFPCFNEEVTIQNTVKKAILVLEKLKLDYEIIVVDDGSTDKTREVAEQLSAKTSNIRVIHHPKNLGYGEALKSGFYNAKYDTIVYTDGDGQFDFSEVSNFIEKLPEADLIIGYRKKRVDHPIRTIFAKGWAVSLFLFFGLKLQDVDCGFKMIKKKVLDKIPKLESKRGAMINAELVIKAQKYGFTLTQVAVHHFPRIAGSPTGASIPVILRSYFDLFKLWWKFIDKLVFLTLVAIITLAAFFRFYRISEYMTFLGDEGRDALMIKRILVEGDFPLLGPPTSVGNIYLGPLYYYMMAVPMAIFWLNPVAAAAQVAAIGALTVFLIYYLGKEWFGRWSGMIAAFLYAISPVTIYYSRSSWNPNPAPFFALLGILGLYKAHQSRNFLWLTLTGVALAFAVQMHYLALILLPVFMIIWLYELGIHIRKKLSDKHFFSGTILAIFLFLSLMSPLVIFDFKHNFLNYRAISTFFLQRETTVNLNPLNILERIIPIYSHSLIGRYMTGDNSYLTPVVAVLVIIPLFLILIGELKSKSLRWPYFALGVWLFIGIFGLAAYKQSIFDHYLGFLNPAPYLLLSALFANSTMFPHRMWLVKGSVTIFIAILVIANLQKSPLLNPPQNQLKRTQEIAKFLISEAVDKPFNFALIAKNNYDAAYQFYLDLYGHKPKQVPFEVTDQLFVVCEDPECFPVGHPKYEIAGFGMVKVESEQQFSGVRVFKLISNPSGKP